MTFTRTETCVEDARVVSCPSCAFTFDECHTDADGEGYTCPVCDGIALREHIADLEHALREYPEWATVGGSAAHYCYACGKYANEGHALGCPKQAIS